MYNTSAGRTRIVQDTLNSPRMQRIQCPLICLILLVLIPILLPPTSSAWAAELTAPQVAVKLKDGTAVKGTFAATKFKFLTRYGQVEVASIDITSYVDGILMLSDKSTLKGSFAEDTILKIITAHGEISAAIKDVVVIGTEIEPQPPAIIAPPQSPKVEAKDGRGVVSGTVVDIFGKPLPGVVVHIKGTQFRAITGNDGAYSCEYVPGKFEMLYEREGYFPTERQREVGGAANFPAEMVALIRIPPGKGLYATSAGQYMLVAEINPRINTAKVKGGEGSWNREYARYHSITGQPTLLIEAGVCVFISGQANKMQLLRVDDKGVFFKTEFGTAPGAPKTGFAKVVEHKDITVGEGCIIYEATLTPGDYVFAGLPEHHEFEIGSPDTIASPFYYFRVVDKASVKPDNANTQAPVDTPAPETPAGAQDLLQKAIDAHGGAEKLAAATSITFTSRVTEINGPIHTVQSTYDLAGGSMREVWTRTVLGFKNETTFVVSPAGAWVLKDDKVSPMDAALIASFKGKLQVMRAMLFSLPADQYIPIDGQRDATGNPASALKVKIDDSTDLILLLDPKTSLVYEQQLIIKQDNRIVHDAVRLGAFREFDGVKMATSQYVRRDGRGYTETVIQEVKLGGNVDQELFQEPTTESKTQQPPANQKSTGVKLRLK